MKASNVLVALFLIMVSCDDQYQNERPINPAATQKQDTPVNNSARIADYTFDGSEGDPISLETVQLWTKNYRDGNPNQTLAHFFGRDIINQILAEEGCVGIRLYYAIDDKGQIRCKSEKWEVA